MSFNVMLDKFPDEYMGYLIRTDFRIGIQINQCFEDANLEPSEKRMLALQLLYGYGIPDDLDLAWRGLIWFLKLGDTVNRNDENTKVIESDDSMQESNEQEKNSTNSEPVLDFDFDSSRLYTAFLRTYGVDLTKDKLHYFKFMYMLSDLEEGTAHKEVMNIRTKDLHGLKGKELYATRKLKRIYRVPITLSDKDKEELLANGVFDAETLNMYLQY